ncbi:hypothetical protein HanPI659440_Chr04g0175761 [Helianthus annuus]|nr:hypothetical protein HanPI659440_Chr04g0175761 [Helianthus annuus]
MEPMKDFYNHAQNFHHISLPTWKLLRKPKCLMTFEEIYLGWIRNAPKFYVLYFLVVLLCYGQDGVISFQNLYFELEMK